MLYLPRLLLGGRPVPSGRPRFRGLCKRSFAQSSARELQKIRRLRGAVRKAHSRAEAKGIAARLIFAAHPSRAHKYPNSINICRKRSSNNTQLLYGIKNLNFIKSLFHAKQRLSEKSSRVFFCT